MRRRLFFARLVGTYGSLEARDELGDLALINFDDMSTWPPPDDEEAGSLDSFERAAGEPEAEEHSPPRSIVGDVERLRATRAAQQAAFAELEQALTKQAATESAHSSTPSPEKSAVPSSAHANACNSAPEPALVVPEWSAESSCSPRTASILITGSGAISRPGSRAGPRPHSSMGSSRPATGDRRSTDTEVAPPSSGKTYADAQGELETTRTPRQSEKLVNGYHHTRLAPTSDFDVSVQSSVQRAREAQRGVSPSPRNASTIPPQSQLAFTTSTSAQLCSLSMSTTASLAAADCELQAPSGPLAPSLSMPVLPPRLVSRTSTPDSQYSIGGGEATVDAGADSSRSLSRSATPSLPPVTRAPTTAYPREHGVPDRRAKAAGDGERASTRSAPVKVKPFKVGGPRGWDMLQ